MANPKLTVTITADGYVTIATSANLATIQKCLSVICEERLASPPSAEAVALEAAEERHEAQVSELRQANYKMDQQIKELLKKIPSPMTDKQPEPATA